MSIKIIFLLGIKGVAMANLALIYKYKGFSVFGWDTNEEFITDSILNEAGVRIFTNNNFLVPEGTTEVIYSASHGGLHNPIIQDAIDRGIPATHQSELIARLLNDFDTTIGVTGCHGKTTTSGLLAFVLSKLSTESSHLVGVSKFNSLNGGEYKGNKYFVFEADEYALDPPTDKTPKFLKTIPNKAIVTNIDFDHPDVYENIEDITKAYEKFMNHVLDKQNSTLVLSADDSRLKDFAKKNSDKNIILYASLQSADVYYHSINFSSDFTSFKVSSPRFKFENEEVRLKIFGEKNVSNATGVIAMLLELGFDIKNISAKIESYTGPARRMELIEKVGDTYLFDDYAHHPQEIEATISAMKNRFLGKRIVVIFQPHTFSRTASLLNEFASSLAKADLAYIMPIFASARENKDSFSISSKDIELSGIKNGIQNVKSCSTVGELISHLKNEISAGDVILTMGAGDVYKLADDIIDTVKTIKD